MAISKLAVIGECMAELSGFESDSISLKWGGDVLNTAIYCKRAMQNSVAVSVVTAMGTEQLSRQIIQDWADEGLSTEHVIKDERHHVGLYAIHNHDDGERTFTYWRNDSAAKYMMQHPNVDSIFGHLSDFDAVYFSGISLAILPQDDRQKLVDQLAQLKRHGIKVIFDGNYRARLWESDSSAQACYKQAYALADLLLLTFDDEAALWGDKDIEDCAQRLSTFNQHELVIKSGADGCYYLNNLAQRDSQNLIHFPTQKISNVVDTTAAGDSFNGGFIAGWLQSETIESCANLANFIASQVIQKKGAIVPVDIN